MKKPGKGNKTFKIEVPTGFGKRPMLKNFRKTVNLGKYYSETKVIHLLNALYSSLTTDSTYDGTYLDKFIKKHLKITK